MRRTNTILVSALVLAAILGISLADDPYRLAELGHPIDQQALDHRDSPYAHITWVVSESNNYAELRFFDKIEGGVCLRPTWSEMAGLAEDGALDHIAQPEGFDLSGAPPHPRSWPQGHPKPNPGTLTKSAYVTMFSAGVMLNQRVMDTAGGDPRKAAPNILMIGLGSGVGVSLLAHHFPEASIAVVDIDAAVIDMVVDHYPFIRWLREQRTSDGRPRLKMGRAEAVDARQYIRHASLRDDDGRSYDMVILDAFTDGSTIPPHLMTQEFFEEVAAIMPEDGILFSNIIGSYTGPQHRVLGGAMRAQHAAGLTYVHNMPLKRQDRSFDPTVPRNNLLMASAQPIGPQQRTDAWARLADWQPYPELPLGRYVSRLVTLYDDQRARSVAVAVSEDAAHRDLAERLRGRARDTRSRWNSMWFAIVDDAQVISQVADMVLDAHPNARGWSRIPADWKLQYLEVDWVHHARTAWAGTIRESRRQLPGRILVHDGMVLIGEDGRGGSLEHSIPRVPLFTDARPNADIFNR